MDLEESLRHLEAELHRQGYRISASVIGAWLNDQDYSLQANRKVREGSSHPDRDAQFQYLAHRVETFQQQGQPVISVDAKRKNKAAIQKRRTRMVAAGTTGGSQPPRLWEEQNKVTPVGVFEPSRNCGWVSAGTDHDTAEFAVESIRRWR